MELTFVGDDVRSSDEELLGESTGRAPGPSLSKGVLVGLAVGVLLGSLGLFADWHDARQIAGKSKKSVTLHQFFEHHAVLDTVTQNRMLMRQQGCWPHGTWHASFRAFPAKTWSFLSARRIRIFSALLRDIFWPMCDDGTEIFDPCEVTWEKAGPKNVPRWHMISRNLPTDWLLTIPQRQTSLNVSSVPSTYKP